MRFVQRTHYVNLDTGASLDEYVKEVEAKSTKIPGEYQRRLIDIYVPISGETNHTRMIVDYIDFD